MAIYYVDLFNGSDATADGTDPATPYKTISAASTAAGNGNHTLRVAKTADVRTATVTASWTKLSQTVVLSAAVTQVIDDCETQWTAAANVTTHRPGFPKSGSWNARVDIGGAFAGTGIAAHFPLPASLDLSGYQQVSFFVYSNTAAIADGKWTFRLCSDAAGAVTVDTIPISFGTQVNQYQRVTFDTGGALGANINSIALYSEDATPGTPIIVFDSIIACLSPANSNCITFNTVISPNFNTCGAYGIKDINGTDIILETSCPSQHGSKYLKFPYTNVVAGALYTREVPRHYVRPASHAVAAETLNASGTSFVAPFTISGGWDLAAGPPAQTGETWFWIGNGSGRGLFASAKNFVAVSKYNPCGCYEGINFNHVHGATLSNISMVCSHWAAFVPIVNSKTILNECHFNGCERHGIYSSTGGFLEIKNSGILLGNSAVGYVVESYRGGHVVIRDTVVIGETGTGLFQQNAGGGRIDLINVTIVAASYELRNADGIGGGYFYARNLKTEAADRVQFLSTAMAMNRAYYEAFNGDPNDHRIIAKDFTILSQAVVRHTASGIAWQISPITVNCCADLPAEMVIATIRCKAATLVTVKCWFRRTHAADITGRLVCRGGQIAGVASDVVATMAAAADTWEELSISFTPTVAGVVEIEAQAYGGTVESVYVDDMSFE